MNIEELLEDSRDLWSRGRKRSAFALILIAFAATARRRYPKPIGDAESFKRFIRDELPTITGTPDRALSIPFEGKLTPVEDILYRQLRCQLIHEGELPDSITFTQRAVVEGVPCDVITLTQPLGLPEHWVLNMARAVANAPENSNPSDRSGDR